MGRYCKFCCKFLLWVTLLGFYLVSRAGSAGAAPPASTPDLLPASVTACLQHLRTIHLALDTYQREHGRLPDHLSDLTPKYLPDPSVLHCPADKSAGDADEEMGYQDPKLSVSYSYEMNGDRSNGLGMPLGPFPKSDAPGMSWGTNRHVNMYQRTFYGDQVPVVRCFHHTRPSRDPHENHVYNLTLNGKIYRSGWRWENCVETIASTLTQVEKTLSDRSIEFKRVWHPGALETSLRDWMRVPQVSRLHARLCSLARLFVQRDEEMHASTEARNETCKIAAWLYYGAGEIPQTIVYARKALAIEHSPMEKEGRDEIMISLLADAYIASGQTAKTIPLFQSVLTQKPDHHYFMSRLAAAYRMLGQRENAEIWEHKANPVHPLVGQTAPGFSLLTIDGTQIALGDKLQGKKALLVNFWYYHCPACREEFPYLQKLYTEFKDSGLELIAVNGFDKSDQVRTYVEANHWAFPIVLDRENGHPHGIPEKYQVSSYPTNFLIDPEGRVVWCSIGYDEAGLRAALKKLGFPLTIAAK